MAELPLTRRHWQPGECSQAGCFRCAEWQLQAKDPVLSKTNIKLTDGLYPAPGSRPGKDPGEKTAQKRFAEELRKPAWDRALGMKIHRTAARHPARGLKLYPGNPLSF